MRHTLVCCLGTLIPLSVIAATPQNLASFLQQCPFDMPEVIVPAFPDRDFLLSAYGGIPDGQTSNTKAFAKAIAACSQAGGGRVVVPAGLWLTGPIVLQSHVNLHVERGATILFSPDRSQYPQDRYKAAPIYGVSLKSIAITGAGVIDGSGEVWRPVKKWKTTERQWQALVNSGGVLTESGEGKIWWPSQADIDSKDRLRPYMVTLIKCENVLIEDITLRNSPKFVLYPNQCRNVTIRHANIYNDWWAQNGDGIDISACENVIVYGCNVNVGDDAICMKSSLGSREPGSVARLKNILIAECTVFHGHGGFVIGSNTDGGMQNIFVTHCNFIGTDIGIRVKSGAGKGGLVRDVYVQNIAMANIKDAAISFNTEYVNRPAAYQADPPKKPTTAERVPDFCHFHFNNITCRQADTALNLQGLPEAPLHDMEFNRITISANQGCQAGNVTRLKFNDAKIIPAQGPVFALSQARDIHINQGFMPVETQTFIDLQGDRSSGIVITGTDLPQRP